MDFKLGHYLYLRGPQPISGLFSGIWLAIFLTLQRSPLRCNAIYGMLRNEPNITARPSSEGKGQNSVKATKQMFLVWTTVWSNVYITWKVHDIDSTLGSRNSFLILSKEWKRQLRSLMPNVQLLEGLDSV